MSDTVTARGQKQASFEVSESKESSKRATATATPTPFNTPNSLVLPHSQQPTTASSFQPLPVHKILPYSASASASASASEPTSGKAIPTASGSANNNNRSNDTSTNTGIAPTSASRYFNNTARKGGACISVDDARVTRKSRSG
jgi:hypothetical protein